MDYYRKQLLCALLLLYFCVTIDRLLQRLLSTTLINYFSLEDAERSDMSFVSLMISFAVALFSGLLTDKLFSRYWTVFVGYLLFLVGFLIVFFADVGDVCGLGTNETKAEQATDQWDSSSQGIIKMVFIKNLVTIYKPHAPIRMSLICNN